MDTRTVNTAPLDRLLHELDGLIKLDYEPLLLEWEAILREDNIDGALAGLDGFGIPLDPVTYRPDPNAGTRKGISNKPLTNNNLSTSMYRMLDGPPLAPRGRESRVITNFRTENQQDGEDWVVIGAWEDVLSVKGTPFLPFHFRGEGQLPVRNLAHVRPSAMTRAREAMHKFATGLLSKLRGK